MKDQHTDRPVLRVVRGQPDDAELAAVLAVTAARPAVDSEERPAATRSRWADRASLLRYPNQPGPGAWRASAFPR